MTMNIQNKNQWRKLFFEACLWGDLETVRRLCQKQYLDLDLADIHFGGNGHGFRVACSHGHLEVVKYLLTSQELIEAGHTFADLHTYDEEGLRSACRNGYLDLVKYLLTSPELIEAGHSFANLHADHEGGFRLACMNEHLDVVKYLTSSKELKEAGHSFADIHAHRDHQSGFYLACENGHLEVVKYLLTSQELIEAGHTWADVHANEDNGFRMACDWKQWDLIRWLVMEYKIDKTPAIEEIIQAHSQAQEYFRVREEQQNLKEILKNHLMINIKESNALNENMASDERAAKKAKKL